MVSEDKISNYNELMNNISYKENLANLIRYLEEINIEEEIKLSEPVNG